MQSVPAGWPADAAVEVVPDVVADFGSSTPGAVSVADWSIERQLTGSLLPGQVRAGTGFSVASGSVSFPQGTAPFSPWGKGAQKLVPGGACTVYATHDGMGKLLLGSFRADNASGAVSDPAAHMDLTEDQVRLRRQVSLPWLADVAGTIGVDAAWVIDQIARTGGYYATPKPSASCVGSLPLQGSVMAEKGVTTLSASPVAGWQTINQRVYPVPSGGGSIILALAMPVARTAPLFVTANMRGIVTITTGLANVFIDTAARTIKVGTGASVTYVSGANTTWPDRVQVELAATLTGANYTEVKARARTGPAAVWSAWSTSAISVASSAAGTDTTSLTVSGGSTVNGLQVTTATDASLWDAPTAVFDVSGVTLDAPTIPAGADGWDTIQQIAAATLGAAWVSEAGVLTYRGRDWLRGAGAESETIVSETSLEDVAWSISGDDTADRVTVTYQPPDLRTVTDYSLTVWEATEAVEVPAGATVTVTADIEGTVKNLAGWLPVWDAATAPSGRWSRWAAATSRDGGGAQPANAALQITATVMGTSQVRIHITNTTATKLWTVDGNGNPTLIVRANLSARAGETVTLAAGAAEDVAASPLDVNLGAWVQRYTDAQAVLDWTWAQVQAPRAVIQGVRVKPNLARQLGDIVRITDATTELSSKAIITGAHLNGSHGQYTQTLDLVLLDVTFYDLSQHLRGKTFAQLSTEWAGLTFAQVSDLINSIGA